MNNILRSMKLWQKFAVLGVLGAVMTAVPTWNVLQARNGEIAVALAEDAGLDPLRQGFALHSAIELHRVQAQAAIGGDAAADTARRAAAADVAKKFDALGAELDKQGFKDGAAASKAMRGAWDKLQQQLDAKALDMDKMLAGHAALATEHFAVLDQVADASGLSLDPVAETYFLMTAMVDHLPRLAEEVSELGAYGAAHMGSKELSLDVRARMAMASHQIHYLQSRAETQVNKALALAPNLKTALAEPLALAAKHSDALHELAEEMSEQGKPLRTAAEFRQMGKQATEAQFKVMAQSAQAMEALLHERVKASESDRTLLLAELIGLALVALGLGLAITRSVTKPLGDAVAAADAVGEGNLDHRINASGSDEAAQLLQRLADMQGNLRLRKQEDAERLATTEAASRAATAVAEEIGKIGRASCRERVSLNV